MRVKCENCNTSFNLDESRVKTTGSKVRCSKCKHIFVIYPPTPEAEAQITEAPVADAEQEAGETAPAGEVKTADQIDHDADVSGAEATSDASLLDEAPSQEADSLDLSDIEKMLEAEEKPEISADEPEESLSQEDAGSDVDGALDLSDIEKILDEEDDGDELVEEKSDDDLVFDLDEEAEIEAVEEQRSTASELDLGDLEKMFESDEDAESSMDEALDAEAAEDEVATVAEAQEDGDTLGFDVESAEEGEVKVDGEASIPDLEIKDEDITPEEMLETPAEDEQGFDLETTYKLDAEDLPSGPEDLDLEATVQMDTLEETLEAPAEDEEELDLESTVKIDSEDLAAETEALDLSMEDVSEPSDINEDMLETEAPPSEELEIELEGDGLEIELEDEGLEIELEGDEEEGVGGISEDALADEAVEDELEDFGEEEEMEYPDDSVPDIPDEEETFYEEGHDLEEGQETEEEFEEVEVETTSGGVLKKLVIFLSVVLVLFVLLAALWFLNYKGIISVPYLDQVEIPFLSKQKAFQVEDAGKLDIGYEVENYRFLETDKAGRVFIITGKVKNEYSMPRSFIQMSGSLSADGKTFANTATAYCGNVISDLELSQMTAAAIRTRLGNKSGENDSNVNVKPGEERPFMIVFFDLPEESLDSFEVRVEGSSAGGS